MSKAISNIRVLAALVLLCVGSTHCFESTTLSFTEYWRRTPSFVGGTSPQQSYVFPSAPFVAADAKWNIVVTLSVGTAGNGTITGVNASSGRTAWQQPVTCAAPLYVESLGPSTLGVLVACQHEFQVWNISTGAMQFSKRLPTALSLTVVAQPEVSDSTIARGSFVLMHRYVVMVIATSTSFGTVIFDMATHALDLVSVVSCGSGLPVLFVASGPGDHGYLQVCGRYQAFAAAPYEVHYAPLPNTPGTAWSFVSASYVTQATVTTYAGGASQANVAIAFMAGSLSGNLTLAGFLLASGTSSIQRQPSWAVTLQQYTYNLYPVRSMVSNGESVFVALPQGAGIVAVQHGTVIWTQRTLLNVLAVLPIPVAGGNGVGVYIPGSLIALDYGSGQMTSSTPTPALYDPTNPTPLFSAAATLNIARTELNTTSTTVTTPISAVLLMSQSTILGFDINSLELVWTAVLPSQSATTMVSTPIVVSQLLASPVRGDGAIVVVMNQVVSCISLTLGWTALGVAGVAVDTTAVFYTDAEGVMTFADRNGDVQWSQQLPSGSWSSSASGAIAQATAPVASFSFNLVLALVDASSIAVYDAFDGQLLNNLAIPTDCYSNESNPIPTLSSVAAGSLSAYFASQLPCLFRINNDLTLDTFLLSVPVSAPPVLDPLTGTVYFYETHTLSALINPVAPSGTPQVVGGAAQLVGELESEIVAVIHIVGPSSEQLVGVITTGGVVLFQVGTSAAESRRLWTAQQYQVTSFAVFGNSIYTMSQSGVCRVSTSIADIEQPLQWCHGAYQVETAASLSDLSVSPDGWLYFILGQNFYKVNADDGSGSVSQMTQASGNCSTLVFAADVYLALAVCGDGMLHAFDGMDTSHRVLFSAPAPVDAEVVYTSPNVFVSSVTHGLLYSVQVPELWLSRRASAPTAQPVPSISPATIPPGWTAAPLTPSPYLPSYPGASGFALPAPTTFDPRSGNELRFAASTTAPAGLFTDKVAVFFTPSLNHMGRCRMSAFDVGQGEQQESPLWETAYSAQSMCSCPTSGISVGGQSTNTALLAVVCDGYLTTYRASDGMLLWSSATIPFESTCANISFGQVFVLGNVSGYNNGGSVVVAVGNAAVCGVDANNGTLLFKSTTVTGVPLDQAIAVFAPATVLTIGTAGMQLLAVKAVAGGGSASATTLFALTYPPAGTAPSPSASGLMCTSQAMLAVNPSALRTSGTSPNSVVYAACLAQTLGAAQVFAISAATGEVLWVHNLTGWSTVFEVLLDDSSERIIVSTPSYVVVVDVATVSVYYTINLAMYAGFLYGTGGYFTTTAGNMLVVVHGGDAEVNTIFEAFDLGSGNFLWASNTSSLLPPPTPIPGLPLAMAAAAGTAIIAAGGTASFNASTGDILWVSHQDNQGYSRNIVLNMFTGIADARGQAVPGALVTYASTTASVAYVVALPVPLSASPCFNADYFALTPTDDVRIIAAVVSTVSLWNGVTLLHTNQQQWVNSMDSVGTVVILTKNAAAGGGQIIVSLLSHTIVLTDASTGSVASLLFRSEACTAASGVTLASPVAYVRSAADTILFTDGGCLFRVNVSCSSTFAVTAALLSVSITFVLNSVQLADHGNVAVLQSKRGVVAAVQLTSSSHLTLMWMSDRMALQQVFQQARLIPLVYDASTPASSQQLIAVSATVVMSLQLSSGALLWLEAWPSTVVPRAPAGSVLAQPTIDGGLFALIDAMAVYVSLEVAPSSSRFKWVLDLVLLDVMSLSDLPWVLGTAVSQSSVVVAVTHSSLVLAIEAWNTNGALVWTSNLSSSVPQRSAYFNYVQLVAHYSASGGDSSSQPSAMILSGAGTFGISLTSGSVAYRFEENVALQTNVVDDVFAMSAGYSLDNCIVSVPRPTSPSILPTATPSPPPNIPPGYSYTQPVPAYHPARIAASGSPAPLLAWQFLQAPVRNVDTASGFVGVWNRSNTVIFLLTFNQSTWYDPNARLDAVDVLSGVLLASIPTSWTTQCNARAVLQFSESYGGALCVSSSHGSSVVQQYSIAFFLLESLTVSLVQQLPYDVDEATASTVPLGLGTPSVGCMYTSLDTPGGTVLCFSLSDKNLGNVVFTYSCGELFLEAPTYSALQHVLTVTCWGTASSKVVAISLANASAPVIVWSRTIGAGDQLLGWATSNASSTAPFCALFQKNQNGNVSFLVFNEWIGPGSGILASGNVAANVTAALRGSIDVGSVSGANVNGVYYFLCSSSTRIPATVAVLQTSSGIDSTATLTWSASALGDSVPLVTIIRSFGAPAVVIASVAAGDGVSLLLLQLRGLVFGEILLNVSAALPQSGGTPVEVFTVLEGRQLCVVLDGSTVFVDVANGATVAFFGQTLPRVGVVDLELLAPGSDAVDLIAMDGTVSQVVVTTTVSVPMRATHFATVVNQTSGHSLIVASNGLETFLLNGSGTQLWGTSIDGISATGSQSASLNEHYVFDPLLVPGTSRGTLLFKSSLERTFLAFDAANGSLLYTGSLPLCRGEGSSQVPGAVVSAADISNGNIYVVVGNPCLYKVATATGAVSVLDNDASPLWPSLVFTTQCVVTLDLYGTLTCNSRTTGAVLWRFSTGYGGDFTSAGSPRNAVQTTSNLVLLLLHETLYCVSADSGQLLWQFSAGSNPTFTLSSQHAYLVSSGNVLVLALDPNLGKYQRIVTLWSAAGAGLTRSTPWIPSQPVVTLNGLLLFTMGSNVVALHKDTGAAVFVVPTNGVCRSVVIPTLAQLAALPAGSSLARVFFTECGSYGTQMRSVVTGQVVAAIAQGASVSGCSGSTMRLLAAEEAFVFCNVNGLMDVQSIPQFVLSRAPAVGPAAPTDAPASFSVAPGFAPVGAPTPAPTLPPWMVESGLLPDAACVLNIEALYPTLEGCLAASVAQGYALQDPDAVNCSAAAATLGACVSTWTSNSVCLGAVVYLNTVLASLNATGGVLSFCNPTDATRCLDGTQGSSALCSAVNSVAATSRGFVLPAAFLSMIPAPASALPAFQPPTTQAPQSGQSPAPDGLSAGAKGAIAVVVIVAITGVLLTVWKRRQQSSGSDGFRSFFSRNAPSPLNINDGGENAAELKSIRAMHDTEQSSSLISADSRSRTGYQSL